ncbi:MAG: branched-chain amino acid ABC transporter permease [Acidimicrobiales bacterium]
MRLKERIAFLKFDTDDLRLGLTCFFAGVLLAIMTGPEGNLAQPVYAVQHSLFSSHVWGFLIFGLLLGAASIYRRKIRMGVLGSGRSTPRRSLRAWVSDLVFDPRLITKITTGLIALIAALIIADFTGPFVPDKMSFGQIFDQFTHTRTYGYIAIIFWLLYAYRVRKHPRPDSTRGPSFMSAPWAKVVGGAVGGLIFALCADPWLPVRFSWSYFALHGPSNNVFFHHWTTYLWTIVGALVGFQAAHTHYVAAKPSVSRIRRVRPIKVSQNTRLALYGGALFVAVEAPKFISPYWQESIFQQIGVFCLLAIGLNVVVGFAGLLDLGYVAFYALGAYTNAYLTNALPIHPPIVVNAFFSIPFAILVAMVAGVLLGLPTLRLRGDYLAIVTLGFGEIIYVLASNLTNITDGAGGTGAVGSFSMNFWFAHFALNGLAITDDLNFYYLLLAFIVPILFLFNSLNHSKVGRSWAAIREDEVAAASLGINGLKYKVMAFAIGASTSGVAGVLSSTKLGSLFPSDFALQVSIFVLVLVIFGGMASITGVVIGAAFIGWILQYLIFHSFIDYQDADKFMYLGAILVLTMIFRPQGMLPAKRRLREFQDTEAGLGTADAMGTAPEGPLT